MVFQKNTQKQGFEFMQPNKKLEDLLNSEADSTLIGKLCRNGVISSCDYLKAVDFCREDSFWSNKTAAVLRLAGIFFSGLATLLFCIDFWEYAYETSGFYVVFALFFCLCVKSVVQGRLSLPESALGVFFIALLVAMPELCFGTGTPFYRQVVSFAVFTALFAVAARSFFLLPVVVLAVNLSGLAGAVTVYLPAGVWTHEIFLSGVFVSNVFALLVCEFIAYCKKTKNTFYLRPVLFACAAAVLFVPLLQGILNRQNPFLFSYMMILSPVFFSGAVFFYTVCRFDLFVKRLSVAALCVWTELFLYRFSLADYFSNPAAFAVFAFSSFFSVAAVFKMSAFFDGLRRAE